MMTNVLIRNPFKSRINITLTSLKNIYKTLCIRENSLKSNFKMNEAFIRYDKGSETFDFTFRYVNPELHVDRQFNTVRKASESVKIFLTRLDTNIEKKIVNKKKKKQKKEPEYKFEENVDNVSAEKIILMKGDKKVELNEPCTSILDDPVDLKIHILGNDYIIKFNAPCIQSMELPQCLLAGFPAYPRVFESIYTDITKSKFTWYKTNSNDKKITWEEIAHGSIYTPTTNDIGSMLKLKCTPVNDKLDGPEIEVQSDSLVQAGPGHCPFEDRHNFTKDKLTGKNFRIISYNILANIYADSDYSRQVLFPYCPPYALNIDYRKLLIVKELIGYNSDIICLQEVDKKVYENDLIPSLSSLNYSGVFSTKGEMSEGLSVLYDNRRFEIIDSKCTVMSEEIDNNQTFKNIWDKITNDNAKKRFTDRNTSVLIVTLRSIDNPSEILVIGNTHLYFHPDADHIRLLQAFYALTLLQQTAENIKKINPNDSVSVMLCGDFNSTPVDGVYELVTKKNIPVDHKDWQSNKEQIIENTSLSLNLKLASACGTPEYTNFTVEFADCLDYIFYDTDKLQVTQIIPMPKKEELSLHGAIPSVVFPSDHVAIGANLKWSC